MGTYYVEFSGPPRPIQVIYDRADSSAARLRPEQVHWAQLLDTRLLHLTGITPALSPNCQAVVSEAMVRARTAGIPISFDVNYRQKLWQPEQAAAILLPLLEGIDLLFCAHGDAVRLFGCSTAPETALRDLAARTQAQDVVMSMGDAGVLAWDGAQMDQAPPSRRVVDRLGAGDALAAGVIHGWLDGDLAAGLRYGVALAALALSQHGDMVVTTPGELLQLTAAPAGNYPALTAPHTLPQRQPIFKQDLDNLCQLLCLYGHKRALPRFEGRQQRRQAWIFPQLPQPCRIPKFDEGHCLRVYPPIIAAPPFDLPDERLAATHPGADAPFQPAGPAPSPGSPRHAARPVRSPTRDRLRPAPPPAPADPPGRCLARHGGPECAHQARR